MIAAKPASLPDALTTSLPVELQALISDVRMLGNLGEQFDLRLGRDVQISRKRHGMPLHGLSGRCSVCNIVCSTMRNCSSIQEERGADVSDAAKLRSNSNLSPFIYGQSNRKATVSDFPSSAECVVIGAGIAGSCLVRHLSDLGWDDIVLVEKRAAAEPRRLHRPCVEFHLPG